MNNSFPTKSASFKLHSNYLNDCKWKNFITTDRIPISLEASIKNKKKLD